MKQVTSADVAIEPRVLASASRALAARSYLLRWRPIVMTVFLLATVVLTYAFPEDARPDVVFAIAMLVAVSWLAAGAVVAGADVLLVAGILTFLDVPLFTAWAVTTHASTGESMSALATTVLIAAWLLGHRIAAVVGALASAAVLATWFLHERWSTQQALPDVVWILVASTVLAVAISLDRDRALADVGHAARRSVMAMREVVQLRRRMVADVSHELRTPLTAINGFLDTVLSGDIDLDDAQTRELLLEARRGGERLEQLVSRLLVIDRADGGELPVEVSTVGAAQVLDAAVRSVHVPEPRTLRVTFADADAHAAMLCVDRARTIEVISSLVSNAIRHGDGDVELACSLLGPVYCIDVHDEGSGLAAGTEQHAFEPFATFGAHLGSAGLGLATARAHALAQGGALDYVADVGTGVHSFRLLLPVAPDA